MTDCKGAFAFGYEVDIGRDDRCVLAVRRARSRRTRRSRSAGMIGGTAGGKNLKIVGIGCGDETPALALKETRRLMDAARRVTS